MGLSLGLRLNYLLGLFFFVAMSATAAWAQVQPRITEVIDSNHRITLAGNVHPLARAEFDRGSAGSGQPMTRMLLLLKRSDAQEAALTSFLEQQHDKSSPNYHAWLTPENFGATYGPADADIQAITDWLSSQGFAVNKVYSGKTIIEFSGSASQVQQTFGTEIHKYEVNRKSYIANAQNPQIPAALAPVVTGIVSLNNFPRASHVRNVGVARRVAGKPGLLPLFTFPFGTPNGFFYGVGPGDFATIYNSKTLIAEGNDGKGQTIAIVGETNINVQDVTNFRSIFGLPPSFTANDIILNGADPGITSTGEEGEADLDVQWAGAVAPGATVKLVVSATTTASAGIDLSALYIIEHNLADVMSESYGICEPDLGNAGNAFYNSMWEQAAAQGITVVVSSGDGGSAGCDNFDLQPPNLAKNGLAVSGIASTPFNLSVGGTDFDQINKWSTYWKPESGNDPATGNSALSYIPEIPWNESCAQFGLLGCTTSQGQNFLDIVAGSGGQSTCTNQNSSGACISGYPKPTWQMGVTGMPNDNYRDQPDVSLFASPGFDQSGYIICQQDSNAGNQTVCDLNLANSFLDFNIVGGTSASAPAFAGVMALVDQYQGGTRQGNANYVLYQLFKKSGYSCPSSTTEVPGCVFNDIVAGNSYFTTGIGTNSVPCQAGSLNCSVVTGTTTGVLVDPAHPGNEAWTVGPGYDMVTGLGSVNIRNLVTKWSSVSTVATTTTLTLAPMTGITHGTGEEVTVNVTVKPTTGVATGNVSLIANINGTTQGLDQFPLVTGEVTNQKTQSLPGGTNYEVIAHYAGDGTNAPSDSAPVSITVLPEGSKTFIVIPLFDSKGDQIGGNVNSVPYGSIYLFRTYVTDNNAADGLSGPPSPMCYQEYIRETLPICPSGSVTFTINGGSSNGGNFSLNNIGFAQDNPPNLVAGTYSLVAKYSGDNSYQSSTSQPTSFTVTPAPTQTTLGTLPLGVPLGQSFQMLADMTSSLPYSSALATGTISFYAGGTLLPGTPTINSLPGEITATITTTLPSQGPQTITAKYSGDSNYAASTSGPSVVNSLFPTVIVQTESSNNINFGQSITVTAKVMSNSKGPAMTGQVLFLGPLTFTGMTTTSGTDTNGNQILTATGTTTPQSSGVVFVSYTGDSNYAMASTPGDLITVNIPDFNLGPANGVSVIPVAGQPGSGQITITPLSQTPSTVTLSLSPLVISGYTIALSSQQVSLNGAPVPVTISLTPTASNPANAIKSQTRHAGLFAPNPGDWWLLSLAMGLGVLFLLGFPGDRKRFREALGLGMLCLLFFALGCGGGGSGTSGGGGGGGGGGGNTPGPTSITLTTSNAKVAQNVPFTITATITSSKPLTGTVNFSNYGTPVEGGIPPSNGEAQTGSGYLNNPGLYQITASYSGDPNNLASTSAPLTQVITGTMPATIQGSTGGDVHSLQVTLGLQ